MSLKGPTPALHPSPTPAARSLATRQGWSSPCFSSVFKALDLVVTGLHYDFSSLWVPDHFHNLPSVEFCFLCVHVKLTHGLFSCKSPRKGCVATMLRVGLCWGAMWELYAAFYDWALVLVICLTPVVLKWKFCWILCRFPSSPLSKTILMLY